MRIPMKTYFESIKNSYFLFHIKTTPFFCENPVSAINDLLFYFRSPSDTIDTVMILNQDSVSRETNKSRQYSVFTTPRSSDCSRRRTPFLEFAASYDSSSLIFIYAQLNVSSISARFCLQRR